MGKHRKNTLRSLTIQTPTAHYAQTTQSIHSRTYYLLPQNLIMM